MDYLSDGTSKSKDGYVNTQTIIQTESTLVDTKDVIGLDIPYSTNMTMETEIVENTELTHIEETGTSVVEPSNATDDAVPTTNTGLVTGENELPPDRS